MTDLSNAEINEDWLRTVGWCFPEAQHVPELLEALGVHQASREAQAEEVRHVMSLPAWGPAPETLKQEVREWLTSSP